LEYGGATEREIIIQEILGQNEGNDNLLVSLVKLFLFSFKILQHINLSNR
jgi:hypothetical protein